MGCRVLEKRHTTGCASAEAADKANSVAAALALAFAMDLTITLKQIIVKLCQN